MLYQVHFGANYAAGKPYSWTTDLETVKRSVSVGSWSAADGLLDYGFIHCMDESGDWRRYVDNGVLQFLEALKAQGVVRHIGLSTHTPALAREVLDTGLADMMMFSINPSYDYSTASMPTAAPRSGWPFTRRCEAEGVGISVMKAFAGLDSAGCSYLSLRSGPDGISMHPVRPGQARRPDGAARCPRPADLERVLGFLRAGEAERDYSVISSLTPRDAEGTCVYCQPLPALPRRPGRGPHQQVL